MWLSGTVGDLLGRADSDDLDLRRRRPLGPRSIDPVCRLDDVEVVLDHDDRVALVDEPVQHEQQLADIFEVETRRRLVENIDALARSRGAAAR